LLELAAGELVVLVALPEADDVGLLLLSVLCVVWAAAEVCEAAETTAVLEGNWLA
jgi:hypothetical protein